jgi:hypothetical protein
MFDVNEPLLMLNFVGLYFLILASLVYNFYQSKKMYSLLETMGIVVAEMGEMKMGIENSHEAETANESQEEGELADSVKQLLKRGMELEGREEG